MVAKDTEVISDFVHDVYKILTLADGSDCVTLDCISCIYKYHEVVLLHLSLVFGKTCVTDIAIDGAMYVVSIEDNDILLCFQCFSCTLCKEHCDANEGNGHDQCKSLESIHISSEIIFTEIKLGAPIGNFDYRLVMGTRQLHRRKKELHLCYFFFSSKR